MSVLCFHLQMTKAAISYHFIRIYFFIGFRCQNVLYELNRVWHVIFMHITTFVRSLVVLWVLFIAQPQTAWMPAKLQTAMEG